MRAPKGTNALNFYWMPYDKILSSCSSHHGFPNDTKNRNLVEHHPRNIPAKFAVKWFSGFRYKLF